MDLQRFALEEGLEQASKEDLVTPDGVEEWETYKKYSHAVSSLFSQRESQHDTVGAVALDKVVFKCFVRFFMIVLSFLTVW